MRWLRNLLRRYDYGTCNGTNARRDRWTGEVQFILWHKQEQGYAEDQWHAMDPHWWPMFKKGGVA